MRQAEPIFGLGNQARSPFLSTVDRLNCIVEKIDNGRQQSAILGLPGLVRYVNTGDIPARAIFTKKGTLTFYMVVGNSVLQILPSRTFTTIATLTTDSGPVWMDDNGVELFINDAITPIIYTHATGLAEIITDPDYPTGARGATFLQGRFWVYTTSGDNAGRCFASFQYSGKNWNPLDFITPSAKPTGITGIDRFLDDLVIRGQSSIEWYSGAPTPVSGALGFQPSAGANTEVGAIAERGSAKVGQRFFFVGESDGTAGVFEIVGYQVVRRSTPKVEEDLKARQVTNAICAGYSVNSHILFQVTIPAATSDAAITWIYDASTDEWSKRASDGKPYYRGLFAVGTNSKPFITDAFNGNLYTMEDQAYQEDGGLLPYEVTSALLLKEGDGFSIDLIQIDLETGEGNPLPPGDDPHAILSVSKDNGKTWCMERYVTLGKMGHYKARAQETQLGWARTWAFKLRITDPVPRRVTGVYLTLSPGDA